MPIRDTKDGFIPNPYLVIYHALMTKENGNHPDNIGKYYTHRVGVGRTVQECHDIIKNDLAAMKDTLGGLIDGVSTKGRSYQIFRAEWEEVKTETTR